MGGGGGGGGGGGWEGGGGGGGGGGVVAWGVGDVAVRGWTISDTGVAALTAAAGWLAGVSGMLNSGRTNATTPPRKACM